MAVGEGWEPLEEEWELELPGEEAGQGEAWDSGEVTGEGCGHPSPEEAELKCAIWKTGTIKL